jgi:hypothetical protein
LQYEAEQRIDPPGIAETPGLPVLVKVEEFKTRPAAIRRGGIFGIQATEVIHPAVPLHRGVGGIKTGIPELFKAPGQIGEARAGFHKNKRQGVPVQIPVYGAEPPQGGGKIPGQRIKGGEITGSVVTHGLFLFEQAQCIKKTPPGIRL